MDFLTFLSNVIENLAWPGVVIGAFLLFRKPLTELLNAIKEAKFRIERGGTTIEGELNTVRQKVPGVSEQTVPEHVKKLATSSPAQAIETSWHDLEESATAAASISMGMSPIKIADTLIDKQILDEHEAEAFYRLYEIKDEATRPGTGLVTDVSSASAYSSIAYTLSEKIKQKKP